MSMALSIMYLFTKVFRFQFDLSCDNRSDFRCFRHKFLQPMSVNIGSFQDMADHEGMEIILPSFMKFTVLSLN